MVWNHVDEANVLSLPESTIALVGMEMEGAGMILIRTKGEPLEARNGVNGVRGFFWDFLCWIL